MMMLAIVTILMFACSLVSNPLNKSRITFPMVFTIAGVVTGVIAPQLDSPSLSSDILLTMSELGLVLLLFADGSKIGLSFKPAPLRLLGIGLPLTIGLGLIAAMLLFGNLSIWQAGILAAILAPTDAGLGQVIVEDERVPRRIREALNIEAGLNDGLSVPFLLFFIAMADVHSGGENAGFTHYFFEQFGIGVVIGLLIGRIGSEIEEAASVRGWVGTPYRQMAYAALPVLCIIAAEMFESSMFIAAFVAGLSVKRKGRAEIVEGSVDFTEKWGQVINLVVFFTFGLIVAKSWSELAPIHFLYAALSLTIIRMIPVAISMIGSGFQASTILFMGWFGPRGLASIVLGLVYLEKSLTNNVSEISLAAIATVLCSILLHGFTAKPGASIFAAQMKKSPDTAPEKHLPIPEPQA